MTNVASTALPLVTIVCPVFNEEACVPIFFERLSGVLVDLWQSHRFELLFTNNGSSDGTLGEILKIRKDHTWVQVLSLSRNFGYQASVMSGLVNSRGDAAIIIDVDCEDPPELIPEFLRQWHEAHDVVYGQRVNRPEPRWLQGARRSFYRLTHLIADNDTILDMAEFSLLSRRVCKAILQNRSTLPFVRNEIAYAGFRRCAVPFDRQRRVAGQTHYRVGEMIKFAVAGMLSSSTFPLRFVGQAGIPIAVLSLCLGLYGMVGDAPAVVLLAGLLVGASILVASSVISVYIARIYKDMVGRPLFIVDDTKSHTNHPLLDRNGLLDIER